MLLLSCCPSSADGGIASVRSRFATNRAAIRWSWFPAGPTGLVGPFPGPWTLPRPRKCAGSLFQTGSYLAFRRQFIENTASSMPYQKCKATLANLLTREVGPDTFARKRPRTARFRRSYGMRARLAALSLVVLFGAVASSAQKPPAAPAQTDFTAVNCSGFVTEQKVPDGIRLISGEQSNYKITFARGDMVYINRGQDKGVRVGDRFSVVRPDADFVDVQWFKWQSKLMKAMGTAYRDQGQVRVVNVQPKVSIAEVTFSCSYMQRGDILQPYQDRPAPPFKDPATFDHFAPVSGKPVAMVVSGTDFTQLFGKNQSIYVNLGA